MTSKKNVPKIWRSHGTGTGGYRSLEPMTDAELAALEDRQKPYEAMLARQSAYEERLSTPTKPDPVPITGCVFAKSCTLPNALINYSNPNGYVPTERLDNYGDLILLGGRELDDAGLLQLRKISDKPLPARLGTLALGGTTITATASSIAASAGSMAAGFMIGMISLLWPSNLGDSALYSDDQLRTFAKARTRARLHIEQSADGTLKGYAFYTGANRDWEMVDVVQFQLRDTQYVVDLDDGVELIWTPVVDPLDTLGIPPLEAKPAAPHIWVYPPTEAAANLIVDPIYPPEYKDFILVFPADSGVRPLYVVVSKKAGDHSYHPAPAFLPAYPDAKIVGRKTSVRGGGALRKRWKTPDGLILEWDLQHGAIEMYDARGKHLGEFDPITGEPTSKGKTQKDKQRRIEP